MAQRTLSLLDKDTRLDGRLAVHRLENHRKTLVRPVSAGRDGVVRSDMTIILMRLTTPIIGTRPDVGREHLAASAEFKRKTVRMAMPHVLGKTREGEGEIVNRILRRRGISLHDRRIARGVAHPRKGRRLGLGNGRQIEEEGDVAALRAYATRIVGSGALPLRPVTKFPSVVNCV